MFLVEDKEMQPVGVTFLGSILSSQEAGSGMVLLEIVIILVKR